MKAIVKSDQYSEDLTIKDMPIPTPSDHELLVKIKAIGVGIHDGYFFGKDIEFPYPIGIEASGIIEKTGRNVSDYKVGEAIAFVSMMQPKGGTWAEYAVVDKQSLIIPIPEGLSFADAAAIPVAGNTVLKAFNGFDLKTGDALFIAGASGAIGTFAIQLAKTRGLRVAASASEKNQGYMSSLGADYTVNYNDPDWISQVRTWSGGEGVDGALAIQPQTGATSMQVVRSGGKVVTVSGDRVSSERGITVEQVSHQADIKQNLRDMADQIAKGQMTLTIEKEYSFKEALQALEKTATRHARGKIVIIMDQS